jgi:hypothetical protein
MVTSRPGYDSIVLLTDCPLPRLVYILASLRPYGGKLSLLSVSLKQRCFSPFPSPISLSRPLEWDSEYDTILAISIIQDSESSLYLYRTRLSG